MTDLQKTNLTRITARYRLLVVTGALALFGVSACGDPGAGAGSTTTESPEVTLPTLGTVVSTTAPPAPTLPGATTIPRAPIPTGVTVPRPSIPVATTIPVPIAPPDVTGPSVTITFDRSFIYDGTINGTCPNQTVDFTVTISDPSPPATITHVYSNNTLAPGEVISLGGDRYRIPQQNISADRTPVVFVIVRASDGVGNTTVVTAGEVDYLAAAFPPCVSF
jgi:hypothetical protein